MHLYSITPSVAFVLCITLFFFILAFVSKAINHLLLDLQALQKGFLFFCHFLDFLKEYGLVNKYKKGRC